MNHLIFIVNELILEGKAVAGLDIAKELIANGQWRYSYSTPNLRRVQPGDMVIVYLAGKGFRCFISRFIIDGQIIETEGLNNSPIGPALSQNFPLACPIRNAEIWEKPLPISTIKENLRFISDKKNWGLFFRQSIKLILENDYNLIISAAMKLQQS